MKITLTALPQKVNTVTFEAVEIAPLALYLLAAVLKKENHQVKVIDPCEFLQFQGNDNMDEMCAEYVMKRISEDKADSVAFSVNSFNWSNSKIVVDMAGERFPDLYIALGGLHASIFAEHVIEVSKAQVVMRGEGEKIIVNHIKKLTYTVGEVSIEETNIVEPRITSWNVVGDVVDKGTGFMLVDHFDENRYTGPMKGSYTYTRTDNCAYNADMSISTDLISAKVEFTIGSSVTKSDTAELDVPSGKRVILKIWTNYQKKSFTIFREYSNCVGLWYPEGSGNAYRPVGLIFTQAEY